MGIFDRTDCGSVEQFGKVVLAGAPFGEPILTASIVEVKSTASLIFFPTCGQGAKPTPK
jgi:hypothetical protein